MQALICLYILYFETFRHVECSSFMLIYCKTSKCHFECLEKIIYLKLNYTMLEINNFRFLLKSTSYKKAI